MTRSAMLVVLAALVFLPQRAAAQQADGWEFDLVPMYFWATSLDGEMSAGPVTVPIYLAFDDAADKLGGAFSFHFEARTGRWGLLSDLNFIRLSSEADFTVGSQAVNGDVELDNVMFELGGLYLVNEEARVGILGGLRTYTLSPAITFTTGSASTTPVDASQTSLSAIVGLTARPQLSDKWFLLSRADVGGGGGFTWSAELGFEYRFRPWGGLAFGYKGLGIDVEQESQVVTRYDVVHYGPIFGLDLHWGGR